MDKRKIIYLDDAIEAVCEEVMGVFSVSLSIGYDVAEAALEKLPPARSEIIHCRDCIYGTDCGIQSSAQAGGYFFCGFGEKM